MRQALREARLDLMDLRRRFDALSRTTITGRPPPRIRTVVESRAYRDRERTPEISVIVALYNHGAYVPAALDSVVGQEADSEVIIVDDGSTDESSAIVQAWLREHDYFPGVLLQHVVNQGLPASRNDAFALAEGRFVFVLDADNEVLPGGFARLRRALDEDHAAWFAYGMLERFDEYGPSGLMGYLGWSPDLLRQGNYIDAMALIRADRLRQMGGYSTDRRLYGWEDYDLWCRIAEQGGRAAHVRNVVGRYRASATSMLSLSNISLTAAWAALREHCPRVFAPSDPDMAPEEPRRRPGAIRFPSQQR
jgi:glycosyltransferase involved in cell wall biosynthesis